LSRGKLYVDSNVFIYDPDAIPEAARAKAKLHEIASGTILEKYNLEPRDAIHAATAIRNRIDKILSYDEDFDTIPNLRQN